jgi:HSP20 family protein
MDGRDTDPRQQPQQQQPPGANTQQGGMGGAGGAPGSTQQDQYSAGGGPRQGARGSWREQPGSTGPMNRRGSAFEVLRQVDEEMDRLFRQFWGGARNLARGGNSSSAAAMWMPQVEVFERDGKLCVQADLPGMRREDISLEVENDQLILQGERRSSHDERQQGGYFHSERSYGSFYRAIPLPEGVDADSARANFQDGELRVAFDAPQRVQSRSRRLDIGGGD